MSNNKKLSKRELKNLALVIRHMREKKNLTQEELAGRAGVKRNYIAFIERGVLNLSPAIIKKIAGALRIPKTYLSILTMPVGKGHDTLSMLARDLQSAAVLILKSPDNMWRKS